MLEYRYAHLELGGKRKHCILLPKMNGSQVKIVEDRLTSLGFRVKGQELVVASKGRERIWLDPAGLCWSSVDPTDYVAPSIPEILECQKERLKRSDFNELYFSIKKYKSKYVIRLKTRLEHGFTWKILRKKGLNGFSPDESNVIKWLLDFSGGKITVLAHYPSKNSSTMRVGTKNYYISKIDVKDFASNIFNFFDKKVGFFLSQNCMLEVEELDVESLLSSDLELGQWCYYEY